MKMWLSPTPKFRINLKRTLQERFSLRIKCVNFDLGIPKTLQVCLSGRHVGGTLWKAIQSQRNSKKIGECYSENYFHLIPKCPVCVLDNFLVTVYFVFAGNLGFSNDVLSSLRVFPPVLVLRSKLTWHLLSNPWNVFIPILTWRRK